MPIIKDKEFGDIKLTKSAKASHIRIRVGTDGSLRVSMPRYAPIFMAKRFIESSRSELRDMLQTHHSESIFTDGSQIGKSHRLITRVGTETKPSVSSHGQQIIVSLPEGWLIEMPTVQAAIRPVVIEALRKEAKGYLPRRLAFLANQHGFHYERVRFSHASGRWGSCSSSGTISLNIALMKLPFHLIDYVLIHELSHTVEMNHSSNFWSLVERGDPQYVSHRREMKTHTPSV